MPFFEADMIATIRSFTRAADINKESFLDHAERVAHIAHRLGRTLGLAEDELSELVLSSLLHDVGILTTDEQLALADLEPVRERVSAHCHRGWQFLQTTTLFSPLAQNILEHHDSYTPGLRLIPAIIHVADRVDIILDKGLYYLWQIDDLLNYFESRKGDVFSPEVVEALENVAQIPSVWLDLQYGHYQYANGYAAFRRSLTLDELEELAKLIATIVDAKSPWTGDHSKGVADVAEFLALKSGMPAERVRLIKIAGLLHDIGKLAVPDGILMHPGGLSRHQRAVMQQHTYHTYYLIKDIGPDAEQLAGWAAFHHERLNGTGYPFGLTGEQLDLEARLMAVADITQSLLETRPYRPGMPKEKVAGILRNNVEAGHIDPDLTELAISHLDEIMSIVDRHR